MTVEEALREHAWVRAIKPRPSLPAIVDFLELWPMVRTTTLWAEEEDSVTWRASANGAYSAKTAYNLFFLGRRELPCMKELWTAGAPLKHKMHMWLLLKNRLWTADRLASRGLQHPPCCPLCCQEAETAEHLVLQCSFSREVWYHMLLPHRLHRFTPAPDAELSSWWPPISAAVARQNRKELNALIILVARELWLERNGRVFDKVDVLPMELCRRIKAQFELWKLAWRRSGVDPSRE
ncbi:unnamed protein product [Alopecurus aequalis]